MALSHHGYDEPPEHQKCPKCLDNYHIHEVDWIEIGGYEICEWCIGSFLESIIENENQEKGS